MKKRRILLLAMVCAATIASSCKKDDEDDTEYNYVSGTVELGATMPQYVKAGDVFDFEPTGAYLDDGSIGYYWVCTPLKTQKDTLKFESDPADKSTKFSYKIPSDTLCNISITVTAYAKDCISISSSQTSTIVAAGLNTGSLRGLSLSLSTPFITDPRDGKNYFYTTIGKLDWFSQNLAWEGAGKPYADSEAMTDIFGHYYSWTEAQTACPAGWRVPSDSDWREIARTYGTDPGEGFKQFDGVAADMMVDATFNRETMWEYWPEVKISDKSGFWAIPTHYATINNGEYSFNAAQYGLWWSSDELDGLGIARYIFEKSNTLFADGFDKNYVAAPVRCVREH